MPKTYKGIYSTQIPMRGAMGAPGQALKKWYWMAWAVDADFSVQQLSATMEPISSPQTVSSAEFAARFTHEPGLDIPEPGPKIMAASWPQAESAAAPRKNITVVRGQAAHEEPEPQKTETREKTPVPEDRPEDPAAQLEKNMRADFAVALARLRVGQRERAITQIEALLNASGIEDPAFRHMFSEFGINLRKSKLPKLALRTHMEARRLSPDDSHILFNAARVTYEMGDMAQTRKFLEEALKISPELEPARSFLDFLSRKTEK